LKRGKTTKIKGREKIKRKQDQIHAKHEKRKTKKYPWRAKLATTCLERGRGGACTQYIKEHKHVITFTPPPPMTVRRDGF
jgi:hypothetical protein